MLQPLLLWLLDSAGGADVQHDLRRMSIPAKPDLDVSSPQQHGALRILLPEGPPPDTHFHPAKP